MSYGFGDSKQGSGSGQSQFIRLSGVFPTAKGGLIGRISISSFNAIFEMMTEANKIDGTLNIVVSKNKKTGKPEMYGVVGQPYNKTEQRGGAPSGPFGQLPQPQPVPVVSVPVVGTAPTAPFATATPQREVQFGSVDVPRDDFDALLESLK